MLNDLRPAGPTRPTPPVRRCCGRVACLDAAGRRCPRLEQVGEPLGSGRGGVGDPLREAVHAAPFVDPQGADRADDRLRDVAGLPVRVDGRTGEQRGVVPEPDLADAVGAKRVGGLPGERARVACRGYDVGPRRQAVRSAAGRRRRPARPVAGLRPVTTGSRSGAAARVASAATRSAASASTPASRVADPPVDDQRLVRRDVGRPRRPCAARASGRRRLRQQLLDAAGRSPSVQRASSGSSTAGAAAGSSEGQAPAPGVERLGHGERRHVSSVVGERRDRTGQTRRSLPPRRAPRRPAPSVCISAAGVVAARRPGPDVLAPAVGTCTT